MGAIQFNQGGGTVAAPQTLLRQLTAEDEHTRVAALASLGVPGQYLAHGHVPFPHSLQLDLVPLGGDNELDALLTVELDQHVVSALLVPDDGLWRRAAALSFASAFNSGNTTPSNFVRPQRSWLEPGHYRAVYHATVTGANGDFTENEADLRLVHGHAAIVLSFVSGTRQCDTTGLLRPPPRSCELLQRWFEPDPAEPLHRFVLITAAGHSPAHDATDVLSHSRNFRLTRLRSFSCQPFAFVDTAEHFEPTGPNAPCPGHDLSGAPHQPGQIYPDHPGPADHPANLP